MYEEFYCLDLPERARLVEKKGLLVMTSDFYGATVKLFQVGRTYVEVYFHPVTEKVMRVSVAHDEELGKHLRRVRFDF